jgi:hypothetical protein
MDAAGSARKEWRAPEGRGAFGGFIGPKNLVDLVRHAAPWLFYGTHRSSGLVPRPASGSLAQLADHPLGWWSILLAADRLESTPAPTPEQRTEYFALCLAAHFASVATYVPTDVDAKIRHAVWLEQTDRDELVRMAELAFGLERWDVSGVSARLVRASDGSTISGHDGERLSVLCGGWIAATENGLAELARRFEATIDAELAREARAFDALAAERGREITLAMASAVLTHNAGDVMQSLDSKAGRAAAVARARFTDLARERFERYGGAFGRAAAIYRALMAPEGHRNYPLREVKLLRGHPDLLLPIAPFLDAWGELLARFSAWNGAERAQAVAGVVEGCRRVAGQSGYYRALAGFERAHPRGLEAPELVGAWTTSTRKMLGSPELRRLVAVKRESFEASVAKRVRAALGQP